MSMRKVAEHPSAFIPSETNVKRFKRYICDYYQIYLLLLPALIYIIVFCYVPMYGVQIAFKSFSIKKGIWGSDWVGLQHFARFISSPNFWPLLFNTLGISVYSLAAGFPIPIILSFMFNELKQIRYKKVVQMITYSPYFISTVAICGMVVLFLKNDIGIINQIVVMLGGESHDYITDPAWFKTIYVVSNIWQNAGWGTILYLAALAGISPEIVEASVIDGANRMQKIIYIDFPTILPVIITLLILNMGSLLSVGFEKILLLQNPLNMESSDVISTYVYRLGILDAQFSYTTAIGLFNSIVNSLLLVTVNGIARKYSETSLW